MGTEMNGESVSVQGIACRSLCLVLLLLIHGANLPRAIGQAASDTIQSFHDDALNITYFYSADFVPAPSGPPIAPGDESKCIKPSLFANSIADNSSFTLYIIDDTCPELRRRATDLGPFTRERALVQLKQYGVPTIIQAPLSYAIAGHPAAVAIASVTTAATTGKVARTIFAAEACALGNIESKKHKKSEPMDPVTHVVCIDFTSQDSGGLSAQMFWFMIQFENARLEPFFPGNLIRKQWSAVRPSMASPGKIESGQNALQLPKGSDALTTAQRTITDFHQRFSDLSLSVAMFPSLVRKSTQHFANHRGEGPVVSRLSQLNLHSRTEYRNTEGAS
jgi:hypothetical protein